MYRKSPRGWAKHWDFILLDVICLELAFVLAYMVRHGFVSPYRSELYRTLGFVVVLMDVFVSVAFNSFSGVLKRGYYKLYIDSLRHVCLVLLLNVLYTFMGQTGAEYSRITVFLTALFHMTIGYPVRVGYRAFRRKRVRGTRALFIVTTSDRAADAAESIRADISGTIRITGFAIVDRDMVGEKISGIPVVASYDTVVDYVCREWMDEIFYRIPRDRPEHQKLYAAFMEMGLTVHVDIGNLALYKDERQSVENLGRSVVLTTAINSISGEQMVLKRLIDLVGGLIGSLMALVIMLVVAIPVKLQSPGPLLYKAERIGLNGKRFKMYKIRSMYMDADERKAELMEQNRIKDGMMFKLEWDPRVIGNRTMPDGTRKTGIGEFMRRASLDEFPQFFNVLKGEMSIVGTRPPTPDEWEKYEKHHRARLATKPGITGMWQVSGRSDITDFEEVVRLDTAYIANWSIGLDLRIIFQTIGIVLTRKGAM